MDYGRSMRPVTRKRTPKTAADPDTAPSNRPKEERAHGPSGRVDINRLGSFDNHPVSDVDGIERYVARK